MTMPILSSIRLTTHCQPWMALPNPVREISASVATAQLQFVRSHRNHRNSEIGSGYAPANSAYGIAL
jgi:hypothetical protein